MTRSSTHRSAGFPWGWFALALLVFVTFVGRTPIVTDHERRVTETAATMARSGWPWNATPVRVPLPSTVGGTADVNPWLVPVFENQIRLQKPPLPYWIAAISFRLFGESSGVARTAPALLGAIASLLMWRLGLRVGGRRVAPIAMAGWIATYFIVDEYRKVMADPYLAFFCLAAIVAWIEASTARRGRGLLILAFYLCVALAALAKAPVMFLHIGLALIAYSFCLRRRPAVAIGWHALGIGLCAFLTLPWAWYVMHHVPGAAEVWRYESVGEFADNKRNARPILFYLPAVLLIAAPWTVAWIASLVVMIARPTRRRAWPLLWLGATVLVFSFVHMKKNAYLLPVAPAIVIGAAQAAARGIAFARLRRRPDQVSWMAWGHTAVGIGFAVTVGVLSFTQRDGGSWMMPTMITAIALATSLLPLRTKPTGDFSGWIAVQSFAFAVLVFLFIAFPQADKRLRSHADDASTPATSPATSPAPLR